MFSELPKLLGRNFAFGYFLPVVIFVVISLWIADEYGFLRSLLQYVNSDLLIGTTAVGLISWLGGILLLVLSREILRFFQGYGKYNPFQLLKNLEISKYERLEDHLRQLEAKVRAVGDGDVPTNLQNEWNEVSKYRLRRFPDKKRFLLPTSLGNTIRAYEVYSRIMYGFDIIPGWKHLYAVLPKSYNDWIDSAEAQMYFWINLGIISFGLIIEYIIVAISIGQFKSWFLPMLLLLVCLESSRFAENAAAQWGDLIKAAFDVYLPDLAKKLQLKIPALRDEEKQVWKNFTIAVTYQLPEVLPEKIIEAKIQSPNGNQQPVNEPDCSDQADG